MRKPQDFFPKTSSPAAHRLFHFDLFGINGTKIYLILVCSIDNNLHLLYIKHTFFSVWYPSGKGLVCKTIIGRFDSYPHLLKSFFGSSFFLPSVIHIGKSPVLTRNTPLVIMILLFLQRVLYKIILWRVPAFPQDAEGLGR